MAGTKAAALSPVFLSHLGSAQTPLLGCPHRRGLRGPYEITEGSKEQETRVSMSGPTSARDIFSTPFLLARFPLTNTAD